MSPPASRFGRFVIGRKVGAGGMGVVYEARDSETEQRVALKLLQTPADTIAVERFKREFKALSGLAHPGIVRVLDAGISDDIPYIAMEFVDAGDIREYLDDFRPGPERRRELIRLLQQILSALAHVHERRMIHRDLKPQNILVTRDGFAKLMDFGVALISRPTSDTSGVKGTFAYMSPEQVRQDPLDGRSDLYSLGIILFELLTDDFPFPIVPAAAAMHHHVHTPPKQMRHVDPTIPEALVYVVDRLLSKDPDDRFSSAEQIMDCLRDPHVDPKALPDTDPELPEQLLIPALCCRDADLEEMDAWCADVASGRGRALLVSGPAGIGKSRLFEEVAARSSRRLHVLRVRCQHDGPAYHTLGALLHQCAAILQKTDQATKSTVLGSDAAVLGGISPKLTSLAPHDTSVRTPTTEDGSRFRNAILGIIGRLSAIRPVLLLIDDADVIDPASMDQLWEIASKLMVPLRDSYQRETPGRIGMAFALRATPDGALAGYLGRFRQQIPGTEERLKGLDAAGIARMLSTMMGLRAPSPELLHATADPEGRPGAIQQRLRRLVADERLIRHDGVWHLDEERVDPEQRVVGTEVIRMPREAGSSVLEDPRLAQLGDLPPPAQQVVERAALLGAVVPASLLQAVSGVGRSVFLAAIDRLVRDKVLIENVTTGVQYRFRDADLRHSVIRSIPEERRRGAHLAIARGLEKRAPATRSNVTAIIARHHLRGESPRRALRYLRRLAAEAAAQRDLDRLSRRFGEIHAVVEADAPSTASRTRIALLATKHVRWLLEAGEPQAALETIDLQAAEGARSPDTILSELRLLEGLASHRLGRPRSARAALAHVDPRIHARLTAEAALLLGQINQDAKAFRVAARYAKKAGRNDLRIRAQLCGIDTNEEDAIAKAGVLADKAQALGLGKEHVLAIAKKAQILILKGDSNTAATALEAAMELCSASGDFDGLCVVALELGQLLGARNKVNQAAQTLERARQAALTTGQKRTEIEATIALAALATQGGRPGTAADLYRLALEETETIEEEQVAEKIRAQLREDAGRPPEEGS